MGDGSNRWHWADPRHLNDDPIAAESRRAFAVACASRRPDVVRSAFEVVWYQLERAAVWISSRADSTEFAAFSERTAQILMRPIAAHVRGVAVLGAAGFDHLTPAMSSARAAFEAGLRVAWMLNTDGDAEKDHRAARVHSQLAEARGRIADRMEKTGIDAARWREAQQRQQLLVDKLVGELELEMPLKRVPGVADQLKELGVGRLYQGFRIASEYAHGSLGAGAEVIPSHAGPTDFGVYWPSEWYLAVNMSTWGCVLAADAIGAGAGDFGPIRGAVWAVQLMDDAPGPRTPQG